MSRNLIAGILFVAVTACSSPLPLPGNVTTSDVRAAKSFPIPMSAPDASPQIVHVAYVPSVTRGPGARFSGTVWASSNVASLEVRTNLFSINARKTGVGIFRFGADVYDLPPIFVRPYRLRVIARTAAGVEAEEDLPFRIR